jgi:DNA-binding CsgD family transcriptional regulator
MTLSDSRNKARALGRIKRLASSGLPLDPFVRSIFELIDDAVPNSPNRSLHTGGERSDAYICSTQEVVGIASLHNHYFVESSQEISGTRFPLDLHTLRHIFNSKTIWLHEEVFVPEFRRAEGFNEAYRPLGWHHSIASVYHEAGEYLGYYGIWRTSDQKPFSREDVAFLRAAATHISHGLRVAGLLARPKPTPDFFSLPGWGTGVVLLDARGNLIALDAEAQMIFQQLSMLDGRFIDALASGTVREGLAYVSRKLVEIFRGTDADSERAGTPVYRVYHHWTGIVLKLRGVQMMAADGQEFTTVLVERGESAAVRRRRMFARWGLSQREAQVLSLIGDGKTGPEIALLLALSHDTVRKHTSQVLEKLGVETRTGAVKLAFDSTPIRSL